MPTVAIVEGVKIQLFAQEHPPAHFHAVIAEHRVQIENCVPECAERKFSAFEAGHRDIVGGATERGPAGGVGSNHLEPAAGETHMNDTLRIIAAEPVVHGVLKLVWNDGYEGIVDLRGIVSNGEIFEPIRNPAEFRRVKVASYGHSIYWGMEGDEIVDFGCDRLREIAEEQAALLARAS
jgi:hypothetical protein